MSRLIFLNFPAHGHTNPTLPIVKELVRRGEEVYYYSFDQLKDKIERTGAIYREYDFSIFSSRKITGVPSFYRMLMEASELFIDQLLPEIKDLHPDYIIHDSMCPWGKFISEILKVPAICSNTTFVLGENSTSFSLKSFLEIFFTGFVDMRAGSAVQKRISSRYHIPNFGMPDAFTNTEKLIFAYTIKEFQPAGETFNDTYRFIGLSLDNRDEEQIELPQTQKPLVYISLGTILNDNADFYRKCFSAFRNSDLFLIISVGNKIDINEWRDVPSNFLVKNHVPQLEVLSKSKAFITHGGMNSVQEGLWYGVPMVVVPQTEEEQMIAKQIQETEAGIYLKKVTPVTLRDSVNTILQNDKYRTNSVNLGESLKSAGGYRKAVDEIFEFKKSMRI